MSRWSTRLRRAASLLLGVHLLQVVLLAASAVCDPRSVTVSHDAMPLTAAVSAGAHHHAHGTSVTTSADGSQTSVSPEGTPHAPSPHHAPQDAACPMAMACTVTAIVAPVPTIVASEVQVATVLATHTASAPLSTRLAPEPPPPRA